LPPRLVLCALVQWQPVDSDVAYGFGWLAAGSYDRCQGLDGAHPTACAPANDCVRHLR